MIIIKNLHKYFDQNHVLKGINLTVDKHDTLAIIGEKGSGKSTLVRCIGFLESFDKGEIIYKGQRLNKKPQGIGIIYEHYNFFPQKTLLTNIVEAPIVFQQMDEKLAKVKAEMLLTKFNLLDKKHFYPNSLSEIERKRLVLADTLMSEPEVIIWDCPTQGIEHGQFSELITIVKQLQSYELTIVILTENEQFVEQMAERALYLHNGKIVNHYGGLRN